MEKPFNPVVRRVLSLVATAPLVLGSAMACSAVDDANRVPASTATPVSPIEAVQTFGQVSLPAVPEIIGIDTDSGADTRYRLAMRLDEAQYDDFLSQFPVPPAPSDIPRSTPVIAGPAMDSARSPLYLQSAVESPEGPFVREIIVDERAPDEIYVHIAVYTL